MRFPMRSKTIELVFGILYLVDSLESKMESFRASILQRILGHLETGFLLLARRIGRTGHQLRDVVVDGHISLSEQ